MESAVQAGFAGCNVTGVELRFVVASSTSSSVNFLAGESAEASLQKLTCGRKLPNSIHGPFTLAGHRRSFFFQKPDNVQYQAKGCWAVLWESEALSRHQTLMAEGHSLRSS